MNSCRAPVDQKLLGTESCSHQPPAPQRMTAEPFIQITLNNFKVRMYLIQVADDNRGEEDLREWDILRVQGGDNGCPQEVDRVEGDKEG